MFFWSDVGAGWAAENGSTFHVRNAISRSVADDTVTNQRRLPDPEICRTRHLGQTLDYSSCLVENSDSCEHAVRFGSSVFCRHPDRRSFEKTDPP